MGETITKIQNSNDSFTVSVLMDQSIKCNYGFKYHGNFIKIEFDMMSSIDYYTKEDDDHFITFKIKDKCKFTEKEYKFLNLFTIDTYDILYYNIRGFGKSCLILRSQTSEAIRLFKDVLDFDNSSLWEDQRKFLKLLDSMVTRSDKINLWMMHNWVGFDPYGDDPLISSYWTYHKNFEGFDPYKCTNKNTKALYWNRVNFENYDIDRETDDIIKLCYLEQCNWKDFDVDGIHSIYIRDCYIAFLKVKNLYNEFLNDRRNIEDKLHTEYIG